MSMFAPACSPTADRHAPVPQEEQGARVPRGKLAKLAKPRKQRLKGVLPAGRPGDRSPSPSTNDRSPSPSPRSARGRGAKSPFGRKRKGAALFSRALNSGV